MGKIVSLSNHKGGVAKTTSTINLGAGLAQLGKRVLLVDLDPQANLTQSLGIANPTATVYDAIRGLKGLVPIKVTDQLDVIASTLDLSGAEIELSSETGREYILKDVLEPIAGSYDFVLIDCPPSLGLLTLNALTASDQILIPSQAQFLATQGLVKLLEVVEKIQKRLNKSLKITGVFMTQYDSRKILNRDVAESIKQHFKGRVLQTQIRDNVALAEAPAQGMDIFRYAPKSNGAQDYLTLSEEFLSLQS